MFGESEYDPSQSYSSVPFEEQLQALEDARDAGKIIEFGVSNETPWGLMRFCEIGEQVETIHLLEGRDCPLQRREPPFMLRLGQNT